MHEDLCAASAVGKMRPLVLLPGSGCGVGGLLVPVGLFDHIGAPVAVEITDPESVSEGRRRVALLRNGVPGPGLGRIGARFVVTVGLLPRSDDFGKSAGDEIDEMRRLVRDLIGDKVHGPVARGFRPRIQIKSGLPAGKAEDEDVVFSVAVEVVDEAEEVVRVALFRNESLPFGKAFRLREIRACEPERAVSEIGCAVSVDVADCPAFGVEVGEESFCFPGIVGERNDMGYQERGESHDGPGE